MKRDEKMGTTMGLDDKRKDVNGDGEKMWENWMLNGGDESREMNGEEDNKWEYDLGLVGENRGVGSLNAPKWSWLFDGGWWIE